MKKITALKIHPAIGIARLGNHPTDFYIGPEDPVIYEADPITESFKSPDPKDGGIQKIKRQAARFRIYAYYDDGTTEEINSSQASIEWRVKLANKKPASPCFSQIEMPEAPLRNVFVTENDRQGLVLQTNEQMISGVNAQADFTPTKMRITDIDGSIYESGDIKLGELKTDEAGRLLVLAGHGNSGSVKPGVPLVKYSESDYWYDDVADGYVQASVKMKDSGETLQASPAWVVCAPPMYVPSILPLISLYDALKDNYIMQSLAEDIDVPKFYRDIYPILHSTAQIRWLFPAPEHGKLELILSPHLPKLMRKVIVAHLIKPYQKGGDMPLLWGDRYQSMRRGELAQLSSGQFRILMQWSEGNFENDEKDVAGYHSQITPEGLDQAALIHCNGAPFFPGIETGWKTRDEYQYSEPFRLDPRSIEPGDLTKQNALPWQADFLDCRKEIDPYSPHKDRYIGWWPYSRPDDVFHEGEKKQVTWTPEEEFPNYEAMVEKWKYLGFIVEKDGKYVETERNMPKS